MTDASHPRQTELVPRPRDEFLEELFRAIRLGVSGRIPMGKVGALAAQVEEDRHRGAPLPELTARVHRAVETLLAQHEPAATTAPAPSAAEQPVLSQVPSPPEQPGQAALAI